MYSAFQKKKKKKSLARITIEILAVTNADVKTL